VRYRGNKVIGRGPPKPPKNAPGPKGGPTEKTGPGGQKLTTFNPATWEKDVHTSLGEALGGKFDAKNGTFVPKEGTSHTVLERRSLANRLGKRINYALDPATVAQIVNDGFADAKTEDDFAAEMEAAAPPAKDEWLGFATSEHAREVARTNARKAAKSAYQRDQATRMKAIEKAVDDAVAMETRAGSQAAGVEDGDGADTEGATETANEANPNDNVPAAPAAAAGAPAAPRRYVMTDPKTKKQVHLDVTDGLTKRLQSLPPGARLPDPRVPGLTWVLGPDGTPRPQ
jgi:hypothetical protein